MTPKEIAEKGLILKAVVGSTAHGLSVGSDDRDEMGICIEPPEFVMGLEGFEQYIYRTAEEREGHTVNGMQPRSKPGDLDYVCYSLRKYVRLATAGNPSILVMLFTEPIFTSPIGKDLIAIADRFASKRAGYRFLGYLKQQKERLLGERGQMRVTRTELIEKYGYDTKYAMQACRLGIQGCEYMTSGRITLPMIEQDRNELLRVRTGKYDLKEVAEFVEALEDSLTTAIELSHLPDNPNTNLIDRFLVDCYMKQWINEDRV